MPQHRFSIGFNTFMLVTAASSHDVTAINVLMNSFVLAYKWSICATTPRPPKITGLLNSLVEHTSCSC